MGMFSKDGEPTNGFGAWLKVCKGCEVVFEAVRRDAVTCSPRCRQRYKRHCDKITAAVAAMNPKRS